MSLLRIVHGEDSYWWSRCRAVAIFSVEAAVATVVPAVVTCWCSTTGLCKRAAKLTTMMDRRCTVMPFADHEPVSPAALREKLGSDTSITHVVLIHCRNGAGVLNPLPDVAAVCAEFAVGLIIDAMSSFAALEIDARSTRFDALIAASGEGLEGVPVWASSSSAKAFLTPAPATVSRSRWTCMTSISTWRRLASGASRHPTHVVVALAEATSQLRQRVVNQRTPRALHPQLRNAGGGMLPFGFKTISTRWCRHRSS